MQDDIRSPPSPPQASCRIQLLGGLGIAFGGQEVAHALPRKIGGLLAKGAFVDLKKRVDYSESGGAPLLGVKGGCIVCHGRSNAKAIKNAVRMARNFAFNRIDEKIQGKIGDLHTREHDSSVLATQ